jgi:hypothetical protein
MNAPAAFIHPCQPIVAKQPSTGPGWAHELKHDGYRPQIFVSAAVEAAPEIGGGHYCNHRRALMQQRPRPNNVRGPLQTLPSKIKNPKVPAATRAIDGTF